MEPYTIPAHQAWSPELGTYIVDEVTVAPEIEEGEGTITPTQEDLAIFEGDDFAGGPAQDGEL